MVLNTGKPEVSAPKRYITFWTGTTAFHKKELHAILAEIMPAHIHHQFHIGVSILCSFALGASLIHLYHRFCLWKILIVIS